LRPRNCAALDASARYVMAIVEQRPGERADVRSGGNTAKKRGVYGIDKHVEGAAFG
jgi:hypothetical protein